MLARRGVTSVLYASDGADALRLLLEAPAVHAATMQCVFLDKVMPVMDGFECAARLRATPALAHLPIVGVTGNAMEEDRSAFIAAGANAVVAKPVRAEALELALAEVGLHLEARA